MQTQYAVWIKSKLLYFLSDSEQGEEIAITEPREVGDR